MFSKLSIKRTAWLLLTFSLVLALAPFANAATLIDLGTLGGDFSVANAVNSAGQVVGYSHTAGGSDHAFLWESGVMTDLGTLPGYTQGSSANSINSAGQVVGTSSNGGWSVHAFLWQSGTMTDLGSLLGGNYNAATDINDAGQIVGEASLPGDTVINGFLRQPDGTVINLGTLPGYTMSSAFSINNAGQVVGAASGSSSPNRAFLWQSGVMTSLGTLPNYTGSNYAFDINNAGQVVGVANNATGTARAFLWQSGTGMTNLGTLGGADSAAYGINDAGQIVGYSGILGGPVNHAFVRSPDGTLTDLGTLGGYTSGAQAINNAGQVVGAASGPSGPSHAFLTQVANCSASITVTSSADSGAGSLRQAMNDVCYGGTITFASNLSGATIALSSTLTPDKPQTIDGSSLAAHVILSGDSNGDGTGDVQVFSINPGVAVTLKALTITKGQATNYGGGLHNQGTLTVTDSLFSYNTATWYGGGIDNVGTLTVTASVFSNNTATFGGGLYNESAGVVTITGSTFLTNTASTAGGGLFNNQQLTVMNSIFSFNEAPVGGGLHNVGALAVTDSTFSNNAANGYGGGGIDNQGGTLTVTNTNFLTNTAQWGGGLYNDPSGTATVTDSAFTANAASSQGGGLVNHGTLTVTHALFERNTSAWGGGLGNTGNLTALTASTFISNTANDSGGGLANSGRLTVMNSTFSGNTATQRGGGLYNNGATATVTASTLSGNRTTHTPYGNGYGGGGIYNGGTLTVQTSTLGDNSAPFNTGGGIYNNSVLTVQASTLSGNSADYGSGLWNQTGYTSLIQTIIANSSAGHDCGLVSGNVTSVDSLIEGDACGVSSDYNTLLGIDPLLGPLADNGGSTQTFALLPGSPAIDVVKLNPCLATDQRGEARDDLRCDIGAFELKYADSPTVIRSTSSTTMTTYGPALIGIQRDAVVDPGVITVTKSLTWKTKPANAIDAYWYITPTVDSGLNLTLTLCYSSTESNGLNLTALRFWQYTGGTWSAVGGVPVTSTVGVNSCATLSGINQLSVWTLATSSPTAITLNDLSAHTLGDAASSPAFALLLMMVLLIGSGAWFRRQTYPR